MRWLSTEDRPPTSPTLTSTWTAADHLSSGRRTDRVHADGEHSLCSGRGGEHDPPKRPCGHGHPHMSTLPLIQANSRAGGGRIEDLCVSGQQKHGLGFL